MPARKQILARISQEHTHFLQENTNILQEPCGILRNPCGALADSCAILAIRVGKECGKNIGWERICEFLVNSDSAREGKELLHNQRVPASPKCGKNMERISPARNPANPTRIPAESARHLCCSCGLFRFSCRIPCSELLFSCGRYSFHTPPLRGDPNSRGLPQSKLG